MLKTRFENKFIAFVEQEQLFLSNDQLLLGVSGGKDSMAMLYLFIEAFPGNVGGVAHCNFGLRGEESDGDEAFVKGFCKDRNIPFFSKRFNTKAYQEEHGASTQMAARDLRYNWFRAVCEQQRLNSVAVGTHKDDVVETFMINLIRGTGLKGLKGIDPKQNNVVRPMLFARREEIEAYVREKNVLFREDSSNKHSVYWRNKIRLEVLPLLEEIRGNSTEKILDSITNIKAAHSFLEEQIELKKNHYLKDSEGFFELSKDILKEQNRLYVLYEILMEFGFNSDQAKNILAVHASVGKLFYSSTHMLTIDRKHFVIEPLGRDVSKDHFVFYDEQDALNLEEQCLRREIVPVYSVSNQMKHESIALFDAKKLDYPLEIRTWQEGDFFYPLGMKKKKKLSNFFIDKKLSRIEKRNIRVLVSKGRIAWVIGLRIDERFKLDENTEFVHCFYLI